MNATGLEQDEKKTKRNSVPLAWLGKIDQNSAKPSNRLKTPPDQAENSVKTRYTTRGPRRRPLERPDARPPSWQKSVEKLGNARRLKVTPRRSDGDWGGGARRRRRQVKRHLAPHGPVPFFLSFHFPPPPISLFRFSFRSFVRYCCCCCCSSAGVAWPVIGHPPVLGADQTRYRVSLPSFCLVSPPKRREEQTTRSQNEPFSVTWQLGKTR